VKILAAGAEMPPCNNGGMARHRPSPPVVDPATDLAPGQSVALLQALHILTRDGRINQDSRRKLKQVDHLVHFIEPLVRAAAACGPVNLVDHGAGKSYLGFLLYDRLYRSGTVQGRVVGVEVRAELVARSAALAAQFGFAGMDFLPMEVAQAENAAGLPSPVHIVTALHACDTATDDAIAFGLRKGADHMVLVPCCQAEVAASLRGHKALGGSRAPLAELWRRPLHTREFGSQVTNVLRCLQLEAHGYQVSVTELVGWEHSLKNELIIASRHPDVARGRAARQLAGMLQELGLPELSTRFFVPANSAEPG
jgi:hypothetical protein